RCARRKSGADRDRVGSTARACGAEAARLPGAGGVHAIDQRVRPAAGYLSGGSSAEGSAPGRDRSRRDRFLEKIRRTGGGSGRHRPFRRVGAGAGALQALRLHAGKYSQSGKERSHMTIKVAINGFGRIRRNILRAFFESTTKHDLQFVAINDLGDAKTNAHLLKYGTAHGRFKGTVEVSGNAMRVNGKDIQVVAERDPAKLPWKSLGVDVVLECTGLFTSKAKAGAHLAAGAKKVIISAPGDKDVDRTVV